MIHGFYGKYKWLSNFEPVTIMWSIGFFPTTENAYQASKCDHFSEQEAFLHMTPGQAQRAGQKVKMRDDWDVVKYDTMYLINRYKFNEDDDLRRKLQCTGDEYLIEGNWWHDNYWGACSCMECKDIPKQNNLGKILMDIRGELKNVTSSQ